MFSYVPLNKRNTNPFLLTAGLKMLVFSFFRYTYGYLSMYICNYIQFNYIHTDIYNTCYICNVYNIYNIMCIYIVSLKLYSLPG